MFSRWTRFLEVNIGVPRGPVDFMSEAWPDNFRINGIEVSFHGRGCLLHGLTAAAGNSLATENYELGERFTGGRRPRSTRR
jgi:hypothetical protein